MPRKEPLIVKCPQCRRDVVWSSDNKYRPFCSQRCKQLDLGAWASESYRVPVQSPPELDDHEER